MLRLAPLLLVPLTSCTLAFGALGGLSATSSNRDAREHHKPETASVGVRILVGALIRLVVDSIIINESLEDLP